MGGQAYLVTATWDAEAKVWVAESDDVPGLVTEAPTLDSLMLKLRTMVAELLEANGRLSDRTETRDVSLHLVARYQEVLRIEA